MTLASVAEAVGGSLHGDGSIEVASVAVDSRAGGDLFVAIRGERVDGHDFATGCAALVERRVEIPHVLVRDTVEALGRLARRQVELLGVPVVGVTGSSGKTSTKDLLAAVLPRATAPVGSYNNEIGLPLTVLRATPATRYLVLEMSARGIGHIARLCRIAPPDVGVVLNVGTAHVGEFGSRDAVAKAKGELVEALRPGGLAVLNADDAAVVAMAARTEATVVTYGEGDAVVRAERVRMAEGRAAFTLRTPEGAAPVSLRLYGRHSVSNALAVAAVARWAGLGVETVADALGAATVVSRWRMEVTETPRGVTVVNDAYNANPESMRAALAALAEMGDGRRTWAVLGAMGELGAVAEASHVAVGELAVRTVDRVVVVGEDARAAAVPGTAFVAGVEEAVALLKDETRPGDVVLVKASRAQRLERVALALTGEATDADGVRGPRPAEERGVGAPRGLGGTA